MKSLNSQLSPLRVLLPLFVRLTASPAPADRQAEDEEEGGGHAHQAAYQRLLGDLLAHGDVRPVDLLPVLVLQPQHVVLGLVLVDTVDVEDGDVAVVVAAHLLLLHGVVVVAGAGHQGELGLHTGDLPGLFWQRRATELHLDLGVPALDEEEMFVVVRVDSGRAVDSEGDRVTAGGGDDVLHLTEILSLVLVAHLLQDDLAVVADGDEPQVGGVEPPVGGGGAGLGLAVQLQLGAKQLLN